ncbi:MAG: hypothetical protein ACKVS9_13205 [Phycisphaerae bacterium]
MAKITRTYGSVSARSRAWHDLSDAQLEELAKHLDQELVIEQFSTPTAAQRQQWQRARRGRPVVGGGAERISLTIERGLLHEADELRADTGLNRSQLVALGLRALIRASAARGSRPRAVAISQRAGRGPERAKKFGKQRS